MNKLKQYNYSSARKSIIAAIIMYFIVVTLVFAMMITTIILDKHLNNDIRIPHRSVFSHYLPAYAVLFAVTGIFALLLLIFYILSIIQAFKVRVHDILLLVGIFAPVIGLIALFIKLVYVNKKIAELKFSEVETLEVVK